jgi:hypothetical protein
MPILKGLTNGSCTSLQYLGKRVLSKGIQAVVFAGLKGNLA